MCFTINLFTNLDKCEQPHTSKLNSKIYLSGLIVNEPNTCDENGNRKLYLCIKKQKYSSLIISSPSPLRHLVYLAQKPSHFSKSLANPPKPLHILGPLLAREDHSDNQNQSAGPLLGSTDLCVVGKLMPI